jgi:hypothetical protein
MQTIIKKILCIWVVLLLPLGLVAEESKNLLDYVPSAKEVKFLGHFQLQSVQKTDAAIIVQGRVNSATLTIVKDQTKSNAFSIAGKNIHLADFIEGASKLPFLRNITFEKLIHDNGTNAIFGRLRNADVHILTKSGNDKAFELASSGLKLEDFISDARRIPLVKEVVFEKLRHENGKNTIEGKLKNVEVELVVETD